MVTIPRKPVSKMRLYILFLNILLTVIGGVLAAVGYNGFVHNAWGHVGLIFLIIGSVIGTIAYGYIICRRDDGAAPGYQRLPNIQVPSMSSESEDTNVGGEQAEPNKESKIQSSGNVQASGELGSVQAEGENRPTKDLLKEVANILATNPPDSPKYASSESTPQSKSSLYISAEMQENNGAEPAVEAETKPLLEKQDAEKKS